MLDRLFDFWSSLKLAVVSLGYAALLVFVGTLAQVKEGLYQAQVRYFKSFFIWWSPAGADWEIPILPGGYVVGVVLLINLTVAQARNFKLTKSTVGLHLVHLGVILMLVGQLVTDLFAQESSMRLVEGSSKNFSESFHANELVLIDTTDPASDEVTTIPEQRLTGKSDISLPQPGLRLRVKQYWVNSSLAGSKVPAAVETGVTNGLGRNAFVIPQPPTVKTEERNVPSAVVEVWAGEKSLGTWLVSSHLGRPQTFTVGGRSYSIELRFRRHYTPFRIHLIDFRHDKYVGTDIPKNYSSRIRLENPGTGENREVLIYMNNPLRYQGTTYYQGSYDPNDERVSILQVVENPGWLTPYFSCALVGLGLTVHFLAHLVGFIQKRRIA